MRVKGREDLPTGKKYEGEADVERNAKWVRGP